MAKGNNSFKCIDPQISMAACLYLMEHVWMYVIAQMTYVTLKYYGKFKLNIF